MHGTGRRRPRRRATEEEPSYRARAECLSDEMRATATRRELIGALEPRS
ncbi:hypothetical protein [Streptomyces atratus]